MPDKYQQAAIWRELKRIEELGKRWQGDIPIAKDNNVRAALSALELELLAA
jgi:hypothetical protein